MSLRERISTLLELPALMKLKKDLAPVPADTRDSVVARMEATAGKYARREAVVFEGRSLTWGELNAEVNRVAHALKARGIEPGDAVALMMENRIEFLVCWLALNKIGGIAAMINTNLTGGSLTHCMKIANSRMCIFGEERLEPIAEVRENPELAGIEAWLYVADSGAIACPDWASDLVEEAKGCSTQNPPDTQERTHADTALYIYTSGTTGFPKAAVLSNRRFLVSSGISHMGGLNLDHRDRIYICLPLYHGTGLFLGAAAACRSGACIVLRRRFSASSFLPDIREHRATSFVYIGELCRYLLNTPEKMDDHKTTLTKAMGNGLRPDIWHEFKSRFGLKRVAEFYGSSEGNIAFVNFLNKDCTVGTTVMPLALVKYDVDEDEIVRDANGHCIRVADGEPGLLLGPITDETVFEGYTSSEETEKKILRNVFEEGDAWFNTGDLMRTVDVGYAVNFTHYQFVDRIGDTFRWKSENVSTNEVGEIINGFHQVDMCNVYGVEIPGADGKAGMASIVLGPDVKEFDVEDFSNYVESELPPYARPVFLRVQREMDTTGTFKMLKGDLRKQGYDPELVTDPLYVMKPRAAGYEQLDREFYATLRSGAAGY